MWRRWLTAGAIIAASGCIDLTTDPKEIVAIEFAPLAWPSVVAGDTLRDSLGAAAPLSAVLYDGAGGVASGATPTFTSRDTMVAISATGFLVGRPGADGTAKVYASGPGVQSEVRQLEVVPRPDSLATEGTIDTLRFVVPDVASTNLSSDLKVKALSTSGTQAHPVRSWVVSFALTFRGQPVAPTDTSIVYLANDAGRPSNVDTTDASGIAGRHVRVRAVAGSGLGALDSVIVTVTARHRGVALKGSPRRLVLPVKPKT